MLPLREAATLHHVAATWRGLPSHLARADRLTDAKK